MVKHCPPSGPRSWATPCSARTVPSGPDAEAKRLATVGAKRISAEPVVMASYSWLVMSDPEGNELCIVQPGG